MIRLEWYVRRANHVSRETFSREWQEHWTSALTAFGRELSAERMVRLTLTETSANTALTDARGGQMEALYDGILELWWPTRTQMQTALEASTVSKTFSDLVATLSPTADLAASVIWLGAEHPQVNPTPETLVATKDADVTKLQFPLRTFEDRELADVRAYWLEEHGPLIRKNAPISNIARYVQVHRVDTPLNERLALWAKSDVEPYLGHAEVWVHRHRTPGGTDEDRAAASSAAVHDEAKFIDFSRSTLFFVEEDELIARPQGVAYNP